MIIDQKMNLRCSKEPLFLRVCISTNLSSRLYLTLTMHYNQQHSKPFSLSHMHAAVIHFYDMLLYAYEKSVLM